MHDNLRTIEIKAFVPAKDYEVSKRFYQAVGFTLASDDDGFAYFHHGNTSFLLQNFYLPDLANHLEIHLLVEDVDAWWNHLQEQKIAEIFKVNISAVEQQPWRIRDFTLYDPSGVRWHIAQNTD
jgi:uncharacterized glyoxalase superfamily protein PhnB